MKIVPTVLKTLCTVAVVAGAYFGVRELSVSEVHVATVHRGTAVNSATGSVTVLPLMEARIIAPEKGNLIQFGFTDADGNTRAYLEGDKVKKGEIIARLDPGRLPFDLKQYESDLERLLERKKRGSAEQANYERISKELEIAKNLFAKGHRSEADVRNLETALKTTELRIGLEGMEVDYSIRRTELQISQIKDQLERFEMRAPFDGVIMAPAAVVGDLIFAGNSIGKVTAGGQMIKVEINQDDLDVVRKCKRVSVRFFSFPDSEHSLKAGTSPQIVPVGNSSTQRFTVFVTLAALPEGLLSGQTGEATFIAGEHTNTLLVPVGAVVNGRANDTGEVFVIKDGRLQKRKIRIGYVTLKNVEVLDGLAEGELVVARDIDLQRDGDRVKIKK